MVNWIFRLTSAASALLRACHLLITNIFHDYPYCALHCFHNKNPLPQSLFKWLGIIRLAKPILLWPHDWPPAIWICFILQHMFVLAQLAFYGQRRAPLLQVGSWTSSCIWTPQCPSATVLMLLPHPRAWNNLRCDLSYQNTCRVFFSTQMQHRFNGSICNCAPSGPKKLHIRIK